MSGAGGAPPDRIRRRGAAASPGDGEGEPGLPGPPADVPVAAATRREAWALLGSVPGLGPAALAVLVEAAGSPEGVIEHALAGDPDGRLAGVGETPVGRVAEVARRAPELLDRIALAGLTIVAIDGPGYPRRLLETPQPPPVLFVRGDPRALDPPSAVAVVGTRRPTEAGRRVAGRIAGSIARSGSVVVSGLAIGVDGVAHAAAVAEAAPTVAVLGGAHDRLFPRSHARLADLVVEEGGAVVSEVGPGIDPTRWSFPRRNRVISGLADATVVVEAAERSGALITARHALEQGRECYVVPWSIDSTAGSGGIALLREFPDAVRVVAGIEELLEDLGLGTRGSAIAAPGAPSGGRVPLGTCERAVATVLAGGAATVDEVVARVGEPVATVLGALTLLEIRGLVVAAYGRYHPAGTLASRGVPP